MAERVRELLRTSFLAHAYTDQTGEAQRGHVVYEQVLVIDTDEHFNVDDGYKVHENHGVIATTVDGRRFRLWSETVAYSGGAHVQEEAKQEGAKGMWGIAPRSLGGYVTPEGNPVSHLSFRLTSQALPPNKTQMPFSPSTTWYPLTNRTVDEHVSDILAAKAAMVSATDPVYGDAFVEATVSTVRFALKDGSEESFSSAAAQLQGITHVALYLRASEGIILALNAEQQRMQQMADDPNLREQVLASMQESSAVVSSEFESTI